MRRAAALVTSATVVALTLLGCGGPPAPTAAPLPASATPSDTPTPEPAALSAIVIAADGLELLAGAEVLDSLGYDADPVDFVARLGAAIGDDPTVVAEAGDCCHFGPSTRYEWPGLRITVPDEPHVGGQNPPVLVVATAATLGTIEIRSSEGYRVGDDCFAIAAAEGASLVWSDGSNCDIGVEFGVLHGEPEVEGYPNANTVELIGGATVSQILAPSNLGIGRV